MDETGSKSSNTQNESPDVSEDGVIAVDLTPGSILGCIMNEYPDIAFLLMFMLKRMEIPYTARLTSKMCEEYAAEAISEARRRSDEFNKTNPNYVSKKEQEMKAEFVDMLREVLGNRPKAKDIQVMQMPHDKDPV